MQRFLKTRYWVLATLVAVLMAGFMLIQGCRSTTAAPFEFKDSLSQYGLFEGELRQLQPGGRAVKYVLSTPLFTDYAVKDRFIVLPKDSSIQYTVNGVLHFPDSTMIVKNFAYLNPSHQKVMIETRLLVKDPADHLWKVMDYLWNAGQTDAIRHITGARVPITFLDDQGNVLSTHYQVPNTNDCKRCHNNEGVLSPIGPKARNLNTNDQLSVWTQSGILRECRIFPRSINSPTGRIVYIIRWPRGPGLTWTSIVHIAIPKGEMPIIRACSWNTSKLIPLM